MASHNNSPLSVPFVAGIRQDISAHVASPGMLIDARNVRYGAGTGSVEMRPGNALVSGTSSTEPEHTPEAFEHLGPISRIGDAGVLGADGKLYARSRDAWRFAGMYSRALPKRKRYGLTGEQAYDGFASRGFGLHTPVSTLNDAGNLLVAAIDGTSLLRAYVEDPDGVRLWYWFASGLIAVKVQVLTLGSSFLLIYQIGPNLRGFTVTVGATGVSTGTDTLIAVLYSAGSPWDSSSYGPGEWCLVAQSGPGTLSMGRWSSALGVVPPLHHITVTGTAVPCSIWGNLSGGNIWIGYYDNPSGTGDVSFNVLNATTLALISSGVITSGANVYGPPLFGAEDGSTTGAFWAFRYVEFTGNLTRATFVGGAAEDGTVYGLTPIWHCLPMSKPDSRQRLWVTTANGAGTFDFRQFLLIHVVDVNLAAPPVVELASPTFEACTAYFNSADHSMRFSSIGTGPASSVFAFLFSLASVDGNPINKVEVYEYSTADIEPHRASVPLAAQLLVSGSPVEFYGASLAQLKTGSSPSGSASPSGAAELGFAQSPTIPAVVITPFGGGVPAGTYLYVAIFAWPDMYGRIQVSAPSSPFTVTLAAASTVDVKVTTLDISQRQCSDTTFGASVWLYRTLNGGTSFKRVPYPVAAKDPSGIVVVTDNYSDTTIRDEGDLYSDNATGNDLAPTCRFLKASETRIWCGGLWEETIVQCSKLLIPTEQASFSEERAFQVVIPAGCTGLAYMDGSLIAFSKRAIYAVSGDGPDDRGVGEFAPPRCVSMDVGCIDYRSILETSAGVFFQSERGFYLLPRGFGTPTFVGEAVQVLTWEKPICMGAALYQDGLFRLARFLMQDSAGSAHIELIYDLDLRAWSYDTHALLCDAIGQWPSGRVLGFASTTAESIAYLEAPDTPGAQVELDGAVGFVSLVQTADIRPWGLCGFGRIQHCTVLLSDPTGPDTLSLSVITDGVSTPVVWTLAAAVGSQYRRVTPGSATANQTCVAVSAIVSITRANGTGTRGPALHGLAFEQISTGGAARLTAGEQ